MCGIAGIISPRRTKFDFSTFCTLGIHNDTRGGDSVGVFIDGKTEYYCKGAAKSFFEDFIEQSDLIQNTEECQVAYLHCRKTSVGTSTLTSAQPVVIYNKEGKVDFVVMHNGTIYNYEELAEKYIPDVDIHGMTDSQVMAQIFYHSGYNVLAEYNGGAVFAIIDYRGEKPRYLFWQGASKNYSTSTTIEVERPLHFAISEDGELVFSSLPTFLPALRHKSGLFIPTPNILSEFTDDLYVVAEYDRKNCQQNKLVKSTYNPNYQYNNYTPSQNYGSSDFLTFNSQECICRFHNNALHGKFNVTNFGRILDETSPIAHEEMWFYQGVLMKNANAFMWVDKYISELGIEPKDARELFPELLAYLSPYPYIRVKSNCGPDRIREVLSPIGGRDFSGVLQWPFYSSKTTYTNGIFQHTSNGTISESLQAYYQHKNDELDLEVLAKA